MRSRAWIAVLGLVGLAAVGCATAAAPPSTTTTTTTVAPYDYPAGCYDGSLLSAGDIRYVGPLNSAGNATMYSSTTGVCSSGPRLITIVDAASPEAATAVCVSLETDAVAENLNAGSWAALQPEAYVCVGE